MKREERQRYVKNEGKTELWKEKKYREMEREEILRGGKRGKTERWKERKY